MRFLPVLAALGLLSVSCAPQAVLVTDDLFRASAPEVVRAWDTLPPWYGARTLSFAQGGGLAGLQAALKAAPGTPAVLAGLVLSPEDRAVLVRDHPRTRFVFFVPEAQAAGLPTVAVSRAEAWALVAARAARDYPGTAAVFYPEDVQPGEIARFAGAWTSAGGGDLQVRPRDSAAPWDPVPRQVFQWAGPAADPLVLLLPPGVPVHGDPGTARVPGAQGLSWGPAEKNLGEWLWKTAAAAPKKTLFLPLETVLVRR